MLDEIDLGIAAIRVMVKHHQAADLGVHRELAYLGDERMPPAVFVGQVVRQVLGVVDQHVHLATEGNPLVVGGRDLAWRFELVVGDIGAGRAILLDAVGAAAARVVDSGTPDDDILVREHRLDVFHDAFRLRGQVVDMHGKVGAIDLVEERAQLVVFAGGAGVDADLPVLLIQRCKERKTLDVVPVAVREENVDGAVVFLDEFAQLADTGTGIEDQAVAVVQFNMDTRRVTPVFDRGIARRGYRATHSIEGYYHVHSVFPGMRFAGAAGTGLPVIATVLPFQPGYYLNDGSGPSRYQISVSWT